MTRGSQRSSPTITAQQILGDNAEFDLAVGYPSVAVPEQMISCIGGATERVLQGWPLPTARNEGIGSRADLEHGLLSLLGVRRESYERVFATFSGSLAIERVLVGLVHGAERAQKAGVDLIVLEPCVDIVRVLARSIRGLRVVPVVEYGGDASVDSLLLAARTASVSGARQVAVYLESPRNPTGTVFSRDQLDRLTRVCGELDVLVVVDHCFLVSGVQAGRGVSIPSIFDGKSRNCQWVALWDTGKTFDLRGDKLGFAFASDKEVGSWLESSFSAVQLAGPSHRSSVIFTAVFTCEVTPSYVTDQGRLCVANWESLRAGLPSGWVVTRPEAGPFACLSLKGGGTESAVTWGKLLDAGVATVSSRPFYTENPSGDASFVRIALNRRSTYFERALQRLVCAL